MKTNHRLIYLLLLIGILIGLVFTVSEYVTANDLYPDEFLDLAFECHDPFSPVLAIHLNAHFPFFHSSNILHLHEVEITPILRC